MFASNIFPYQSNAFGIKHGSDGLQLLWILFRPAWFLKLHEYWKPIARFATFHQLDESKRAQETMAESNRHMPDDLLTLLNLSAAEEAVGNHEGCISTARRVLELIENGATVNLAVAGASSAILPKVLEAVAKNNISYGLLKSRNGDFQEALRLAAEAYETAPWFPGIVGTYGYALGLTGDPARGLELMYTAQTKSPRFPRHAQMETANNITEITALLENESAQ